MPRGRIQSVELIVPAGFTANKLPFPDQPTLRSDEDKDAVIYAITCYESASVPNAPSGNPLADFGQVQNTFLTLYITGAEQIRDISLMRFLDTRSSTSGYFYAPKRQETRALRIDWTESYVEFAVAGTAETSQYSLLFEFEYEWMPKGSYGKGLSLLSQKWSSGLIQ